jgi:hypothetical protein
VLDGLGLLQNLDILVPEAQEDFKAIYEKKAQKQRVGKRKKNNKSDWGWGEDK